MNIQSGEISPMQSRVLFCTDTFKDGFNTRIPAVYRNISVFLDDARLGGSNLRKGRAPAPSYGPNQWL